MTEPHEPTSEPVDDLTGEDPERNRRRWPALVAVSMLAIVAAAAVVYALSQRSEANDAHEAAERQRQAVLVASGFVEALISYDFEDLDAQQAAVERFVTDEFRSEFADAFTNEVRDQIIAERARSTVTIRDVWVTVGEGEEASAIVHALSSIESDGGAAAELESYLRVRLVRLADRWRVDDLTSLGSRDLSGPLTAPGGGTQEDADG